MLKLVALIVPLSLDAFVVTTAVGASGLHPSRRLRVALLFTLFEGGIPLVGLGLGSALSSAIGSAAESAAIALLIAFGLYVLFVEGEEAEEAKLGQLSGSAGWATLLLGLSISIDELAIGFSLGLLHLPTIAALVLIATQAFLVAQVGLRLGGRISATLREGAEKLVGIALIAVGVFLLIEQTLSQSALSALLVQAP